MNSAENKTLIIVTGPTASGKTALAIDIAESLQTEIVSADSRQVFADIPIGTAQPTAAELARVPHRLIGFLPLEAYYSAWRFEQDALRELDDIWRRHDYAVMAGGSMMYLDAITRGLDDLPTISDEVRRSVLAMYEAEGLEGVKERLHRLDPEYLEQVDPHNTRRIIHAVEICLQAGKPYSQLRSGRRVERPFRVVKLIIERERDDLFSRINRRVDTMMDSGLLEEARRVLPKRHLNSLNTVGYKELFAYFDGVWDLETAMARIAKNTRVYAKKQMTWAKRDPDFVAVNPYISLSEIIKNIIR